MITRPTFQGNPPLSYRGMWPNYRRLSTVEKFTPPFVWEGRVQVNEVMEPAVFGNGWRKGQAVWYQPTLAFHPLYASNNRNIVVTLCNPMNPTAVGISAEMRDVRPERPYGSRSGYEFRVRNPLKSDPIGDGQLHWFRWEVYEWAHYALFWDCELVADICERKPSTILGTGPVSLGLRLDFLDVVVKNQKVHNMGWLER